MATPESKASDSGQGGTGNRRLVWFVVVVVAVIGGLVYRTHLRRQRMREEFQTFATKGQGAARAKATDPAAEADDEALQPAPVTVSGRSCQLQGVDGSRTKPPDVTPTVIGQKEAQGLVAQAMALQAKGQMVESLPLLDQALAQDPTNTEGYFARGQARSRGTDLKAAEQDLLLALALKPGYPEALDNLAAMYLRATCIDFAQAAAQHLIDQNPTFHPERSYYLRASARQKRGDLRGALEDAEHACQLGNQDACEAKKAYIH